MATKDWLEDVAAKDLQIGDCIFIQGLAYNVTVLRIEKNPILDRYLISWGSHPSQGRRLWANETVERMR